MSPHRLNDPLLLRSALHSIPDAVIIHDEETILYANPAALKLLKASSASQVLGHPMTDLVHPDAREGMQERMQAMVEQDIDVSGFVEKLQTFDGETLYAELQGSVVEGAEGEHALMVIAKRAN